MSEFNDELQRLLNRCSKENVSNTPDFILANYLDRCLKAFDYAVNQRATWFGRMDRIGGEEISK
mgnify:CR=1 FL=1